MITLVSRIHTPCPTSYVYNVERRSPEIVAELINHLAVQLLIEMEKGVIGDYTFSCWPSTEVARTLLKLLQLMHTPIYI